MKKALVAALTLVVAQASGAAPELRYEPPANFYRSAISPPDDYSANDVNAGLQVYALRPFSGNIEQAFRRSMLREWIDPRYQEANVVAPPDFRPGLVVPGAQLTLSARFAENVGGVVRQRQRMLIVAGDSAAILDAWAASMPGWQQILPRLNAMAATMRVEAGAPAPNFAAPPGAEARAIAGLYEGIKTNMVSDLMRGPGKFLSVPTLHYYLFSADGRVFRAYNQIAAPGGIARFDFEAARRTDPGNSGRYVADGGVLRIRMGEGQSAETIDVAMPRDGRLRIQSVDYRRQ